MEGGGGRDGSSVDDVGGGGGGADGMGGVDASCSGTCGKGCRGKTTFVAAAAASVHYRLGIVRPYVSFARNDGGLRVPTVS